MVMVYGRGILHDISPVDIGKSFCVSKHYAMLSDCDVCRQEGGANPWAIVMRVVHLSIACRSRTMMDDLA